MGEHGAEQSLPATWRLDRWTLVHLFLACAVLLGVQVGMVIAGDSRAFQGSDAGGRAASLDAAIGNESCDHTYGYWAADVDPSGRFHPLINSEAIDRRYAQPADPIFICGSARLVSHFGSSARFALPIAGVIAAAVGAWLLARDDGRSSGWPAFFLIGATSPVAFYGTSIWEHAPAAGCAVLGTALVLTGRGRVSGVAGGLLWGFAMAFRLDTAVVAATLVLAVLVIGPFRAWVLRSWQRLCFAALAAVGVLVYDRSLQLAAVGQDVSSSRARGSLGQAGEGLGVRATDVIVTNVGLYGTDTDPRQLLIGAVAVLALAIAAGVALACHPLGVGAQRVVGPAAAVGLILYAGRVSDLAFVPGMFAATPLAVVGLWSFWTRIELSPLYRALGWAALAALPPIWVLQWRGDLSQQWGGRYQLVSGAFLALAGLELLRSTPRAFQTAMVALTVVVAGIGVRLHVERSQFYAHQIAALVAYDCGDSEILLSTSPHLLREGGGFAAITAPEWGGCRYLTSRPGDYFDALDVAAAAGITRVAVLDSGHDPDVHREPPGWRIVSDGRLDVGPTFYRLVELSRST